MCVGKSAINKLMESRPGKGKKSDYVVDVSHQSAFWTVFFFVVILVLVLLYPKIRLMFVPELSTYKANPVFDYAIETKPSGLSQEQVDSIFYKVKTAPPTSSSGDTQ